MAKADMARILGALLGGAARGGLRPARRRRRSPAPLLDVRVGGSRAAATALATLAGAVLGSVFGGGQAPAPRPAPPPAAPRQRRSGAPADARPADARPADVAPAQPLPNPWSSPPKPAPLPAHQPEASAEDAEALLILRAMISCAKADGSLDAAERGAIAAQLDEAGLDQVERDLVLAEFAGPAGVAEIAAAVTDPVLAAQVYAAAYLAAGEVAEAERAWLTAFAAAAGLDGRAAAEIERRLESN
jgi:uncharacterized membrane protein YebE (DUF533 family)